MSWFKKIKIKKKKIKPVVKELKFSEIFNVSVWNHKSGSFSVWVACHNDDSRPTLTLDDKEALEFLTNYTLWFLEQKGGKK